MSNVVVPVVVIFEFLTHCTRIHTTTILENVCDENRSPCDSSQQLIETNALISNRLNGSLNRYYCVLPSPCGNGNDACDSLTNQEGRTKRNEVNNTRRVAAKHFWVNSLVYNSLAFHFVMLIFFGTVFDCVSKMSRLVYTKCCCCTISSFEQHNLSQSRKQSLTFYNKIFSVHFSFIFLIFTMHLQFVHRFYSNKPIWIFWAANFVPGWAQMFIKFYEKRIASCFFLSVYSVGTDLISAKIHVYNVFSLIARISYFNEFNPSELNFFVPLSKFSKLFCTKMDVQIRISNKSTNKKGTHLPIWAGLLLSMIEHFVACDIRWVSRYVVAFVL